jgi:hypothetical protein
MKKMFGLVVALLILYIALQVVYSYVIGSQTNSYSIAASGDVYQVVETYTSRHKSVDQPANDKSNYYYEIKKDNQTLFSFKLIGSYKGVKQFLRNLSVYKDSNLICAYPVFKEKIADIDAQCNLSGKHYLYGVLKGQNAGLDAFVASLKSLGYIHPSWDQTNLEAKRIGNFELYTNNIETNESFIIWQYDNYYRITDRGANSFSLNTIENREPNLTAMINQYYIVPDYKDNHAFNRIYITNLISGSMETMNFGVSITDDSFIQGVVDKKLYIIDRSNKVQYAIDIYNKEIKISGDTNNYAKYYTEGKWQSRSITEVIANNLRFNYQSIIPVELKVYNPLYVDEIGGDTDGYYYLYLKENNGVNVYRVDKQNTGIMTLIFTMPAINNIKYSANSIYFVSNDTLYTYRDNIGLRPIIKYSQFATNKPNLYNVYVNE